MKQNYKKIFMGILAAVTVCGSLATFTLHPGISSAAVPNSTKGVGKMESGAVSTDIFNVVLPAVSDKSVDKDTPTTNIYDFILDPKKLLTSGLAAEKYPGKTFEPNETLYFENTAGSVSYNYSHTSDSLTVQNKGTVNVDVKLNAVLTGMKNIILTSDSAFNNDKYASVYLSLVDDNGKKSAIDKYGAFLRKTLVGRQDAYKIIYDPADNQYKYGLKSDSELQAGDITFQDYSFWLTGACNPTNDWSNLPEPITPEITVTWIVSPRPNNVAPSIGKTFYSMTKDQANTIDVDLGSGNLAATGIDSIIFQNNSGTNTALGVNDFTFDSANETLIFNTSYINSLINAGVKSRSHIITFKDESATQITVTLTINDRPPSIEQTSYIMTKDQPVLVDIDLGAGDLGATGIKLITLKNKAGADVTLATNMYTFTDGILKFKAEHINNSLKNGFTTRDYVITMNDKALTKMTITLNMADDSKLPDIIETSYTMSRNKPVLIDVDLGNGDLKAEGIKSIIVKNKAGADVTLATNMYTFNNNILTLIAEHINNSINNGFMTRDYTIIFDDIAETQVKVTLTVQDALPSIEQLSYIMTKNQPVSVNIDLGSGNLGATAIKSITLPNKAGEYVTLATNMYTFSNGVLTLKAEHINNSLKGGFTTRDYTIIMNDKNATSLKITLTVAEGVKNPSIAVKSYTTSRNKPVSVNVDLGTGDLKATGIKSITLPNKAGTNVTLATDMYSFSGGVLTFTATHINNSINGGFITRNYTITFNNIAETQEILTLTAADVSPSIKQTSYKMTKGQPVLVNIDLGSGNLGATAIKSIALPNKAGEYVTLATNMYTFNNGVLTLTATHINNSINGGFTTRDYIITLNDKNSTSITVILTR